ncbi:hypothetical protein Hypma_002946 [Hypsizygus marmoreus]|uniref:F-box domain-containing protein n=1 Tax=Hypsizygus marmoreus TaxID=39966 RepID=A0A369J707_HYPMA|nr:hypothetical protein Hypma_002946 [Hypsizygus marmoreus]
MDPNLNKPYPLDRDWICAKASNTAILSDQEIWVAKSLLSETLKDVEHLNLEITHAPEILDDLVIRRDEEVARADKIRIVIAPHKRVPPEILSEIFAQTIEGIPLMLPLRFKWTRWPWPLRSVCSLWRRIAISDRRLWDSIEVSIWDWSPSLGHRLSQTLTQIWLPFRAGVGPSKLKIDVDGEACVDQNIIHPITYLLFPFLPSLRKLYLQLPLSWCLALLDAPALNLTHLETLSLECTVDDCVIDHPGCSIFGECLTATDVFSMSPSLRKLRIRDISYLESFDNGPFPWAQLTDLDLSQAETKTVEAIRILQQCTQLVGCSLMTTGFADPNEITDNHIVLPYLQSLAWLRYDINEYAFGPLIAPSLKEFHVSSIFITEVLSMIQNFEISIELFQFENIFDRDRQLSPHLEEIISRLPSLVEFETSYQVPLSTLEKVLSGELLPHLKVLECTIPSESVDSFIATIEGHLQDKGGSRATLSKFIGMLLPSSQPVFESAKKHVERIRDQYGVDFQLRENRFGCILALRRRILVEEMADYKMLVYQGDLPTA